MKLQVILAAVILLLGILTFSAWDSYFGESKVNIENSSGKDISAISLASTSASCVVQYKTIELLRSGESRQITLYGAHGEGTLILRYDIEGVPHDWNGGYFEPHGYKMRAIVRSDGTVDFKYG